RQAGQGLGLDILLVLIPIWAVGLAGVFMLLAAWVKHPDLYTELRMAYPTRSDGRHFGWFTRALACFTLFWIWVGTLAAVAMASTESFPLWQKGLVIYCVTAYCWFLFYLSFL